MRSKGDKEVGLVGGSIARRIAASRVAPIDDARVLAPFRNADDRHAFESFTEAKPLEVEVGFGRAHHLLALAASTSDHHILGFEIRRQWCRQAARGAERHHLTNVRVVEGDARPFLEQLVAPGAVQRFHILFPDPWWKRRHHKRRVFSKPWLDVLWRLLAPDGDVIAKTDVPCYADLIEREVQAHGGFRLDGTHLADPVLCSLPRSHREKKCAEHQIPVYAFHFVREPVGRPSRLDEPPP